MEKDKLILKNVQLLFVNEKSDSYNRSITVEVTNEEERLITEWVKNNNIGTGDNAGVAQIMQHEFSDGGVRKYFYFKPDSNTSYTDSTGSKKLTFENLTKGSTISLIARATPYNYKDEYGMKHRGMTHRLTGVVVGIAAPNTAFEDTKELLDELNSDTKKEEDIDLSDIPF